jgi:large subunit ribosomal protein L20
MPRAKGTVPGKARRRKVLKAVKGHRGGRHRLYRTAKDALMKSLQHAYDHRRQRKREFRRFWIIRINAAAREHGLSYSNLIHGLKQANVHIDRRQLAEMAVHDSAAFAKLVDIAKAGG